jgi:hypothetical protein
MKKITFSNADTRNVFAEKDYNEFHNLMFDTALGKQEVSKEDANAKIREVMFQILGVDEKCSKQELRKAIRRHKVDVFEVIEETIQDLLVSGWGQNPFFNEYVEIKSMAIGDTNEFYVPDKSILTVAELSGNHHDLFRQRLGAGSTFSVKTSWYGAKIYAEYELFMAGHVDWAGFVQKIYEAFDKKINDMVYAAVMAAPASVTPSAQFNKSGSLDKATLVTLVEDVQTANGVEAVIMGTKTALSKVADLTPVTWYSGNMKDERNTTGKLGIWEGIRLVEIPQSFAPNDTTTKLVANNVLLVMPMADNKFIKIYDEGDAQIKEISDGNTNMDKTIEYEYQQKLGVATIINRKFGAYTFTTN